MGGTNSIGWRDAVGYHLPSSIKEAENGYQKVHMGKFLVCHDILNVGAIFGPLAGIARIILAGAWYAVFRKEMADDSELKGFFKAEMARGAAECFFYGLAAVIIDAVGTALRYEMQKSLKEMYNNLRSTAS
jgi:hypothetical protein